jgi:hypothetical protein
MKPMKEEDLARARRLLARYLETGRIPGGQTYEVVLRMVKDKKFRELVLDAPPLDPDGAEEAS